MRRILVIAALVAAFVPAEAGAITTQELTLPMSDGATIAATLFVPDGTPPAGGWPAIMALHGIGNTRSSPEGAVGTRTAATTAAEWAARGYVVLTFDARAHGESGGLFSLDGPREIEDVRALFNWLDSRPDVDGTKIGAFAISLGGGAAWRALVDGVPFATIVPVAAWTDLYEALLPQNLSKSGAIFLFSGSVAAKLSPETKLLLDDAYLSTNLPAIRSYLLARSTRAQLDQVRTPVFMLQGRRDFAFDIDQALAAYTRLKGPKRLYIGDFGHSPAPNPAAEQPYYMEQVRLWFDHFLKGMPNGIDTRPRIELAPDPWTGKTTSYAAIPKRTVLNVKLPGVKTIDSNAKVVRTVKLPRRLETFGSPVAKVTVSTPGKWSHLVAVLTAVTPAGTEVIVSEGGVPTTTLGRRARTVTIKMISVATHIPPGSRLRLTLAGTSSAQHPSNLLYLFNVTPGSRLTVGRATVALPLLAKPISR